MAGVRKKPLKSGNYQGYFVNHEGKRRFFVGTDSRRETLEMARGLEHEHRQIRLGYKPAPKSHSKPRTFQSVVEDYLAWGRSQGGRGGRPWSPEHSRKRERDLAWWQERLGFEQLADVKGCLPRVEKALQECQRSGNAGKTLQNRAEAIKALFEWAKGRGLLQSNPLDGLATFDTTPLTTRRALTEDEIQRILVATEATKYGRRRRLGYELALASGLRAGELRKLRVKHLTTERCGLYLEADLTKNKKPGFQPLPKFLVDRLARSVVGKDPEDPLVFVPRDASTGLRPDLRRAGVPIDGPGGKVDFHALRTAYVSFVLESGASAKEAQHLARHSTPSLTMNTYARARLDRLADIAEKVGEVILPDAESTAVEATGTDGEPVLGRTSARSVHASTTRSHKANKDKEMRESPRGFESPPTHFSDTYTPRQNHDKTPTNTDSNADHRNLDEQKSTPSIHSEYTALRQKCARSVHAGWRESALGSLVEMIGDLEALELESADGDRG